MKVDFDGLRKQAINHFNSAVRTVNLHISDGELEMDEWDLGIFAEKMHDLRMCLVTLAFLSSDGEVFGELKDPTFDTINIPGIE